MISVDGNLFELKTDHTLYRFGVTRTGHLVHLYYGKKTGPDPSPSCALAGSAAQQALPIGNLISYDPAWPDFTPENVCFEMSAYGKGDIREPLIELLHANGSRTCDFRFAQACILPDKKAYETLPGSYGMPENEHLRITLREPQESDTGGSLILELHYYVYPQEDLICRSCRLLNASGHAVRIRRLMSTMLDLPDSGYIVTAFTGAWLREMQQSRTYVSAGTFRISSVCGSSSNRANPFFMLGRADTAGQSGDAFGFNLIYSGNHAEIIQVNAFGQTRILTGINPDGFDWLLSPGEAFEAPEAMMTFSDAGYRGISRNMDRFIRRHIVRGVWQSKNRPIALNSWEAFYFDFDEERLLRLARMGKDVGIELFVLDDGWFRNRNNDASALGDWTADPGKLPDGLSGLARKIRALDMDFGLWIEPEMVSTDSELYHAHPDWAMEIPGQRHAEGRSQRILDLANPEVVDYLSAMLEALLSSADISYVKWDMNRIFSDTYSPWLMQSSREAESSCMIGSDSVFLGTCRQGETAHRYMIGLYRLLRHITKAFPDILFEGCAAGGGRFDPGMLCYFPQIWASDNTDPVCRSIIQEGYSYGYPMSCISSHVAAAVNHQTGRRTTLAARFQTAAAGILGYELNLCEISPEELDEIRGQIALYRKWRPVLQNSSYETLQRLLPEILSEIPFS